MNLSFSREPALWLGVAQAILGLIIGFGVHITTEQAGLIMAVAAAIAAVIVRQNVYAPVDKDGAPIEVPKT
jgi:hypothetical protein